MPENELERKLDEGLALLRAIRSPRRRIAVALASVAPAAAPPSMEGAR